MVKGIWATYCSKATVKGSCGLLLMVVAQSEQHNISRTVVTTPPLCPVQGLPTGPSQPPTASCPWRGPLFLHSVILRVLRLGPAFCLATSHLAGSEAAEMCTTDGRNYVAHLTSEIFFFFPFSSLSLPFPQITPRLGKLIDSLCKWAFELYKEDFWLFQQSPL